MSVNDSWLTDHADRHVLSVLPHPDDETFGFGGIIARFTRHGVPVTVLCATLGQMGRQMGRPPFATRESMAALRERELRDACAILGVTDVRVMGLRDKTLEFEPPERLDAPILDAIRSVRPTTILMHYPGHGVHPDHDALSAAVARVVRAMPPAERPRLLAHAVGKEEVLRDAIGEPDVIVDVTPVLDVKLAATRAHRSQSEGMLARAAAQAEQDEAFRARMEEGRRRERYHTYRVEDEPVEPLPE